MSRINSIGAIVLCGLTQYPPLTSQRSHTSPTGPFSTSESASVQAWVVGTRMHRQYSYITNDKCSLSGELQGRPPQDESQDFVAAPLCQISAERRDRKYFS